MVLYPGDVLRIARARKEQRINPVYVCIDFHLKLYLLALDETPFHGSFVRVWQEDWLEKEIFVQTNTMHEVVDTRALEPLGKLSHHSKELIVRHVRQEKALLETDKTLIAERLLGDVDVFYHDHAGEEDLD